MNIRSANEIIASLPQDRTLFGFYEDRPAMLLLQQVVTSAVPVAELKKSRFAKLLDRPVIKHIIAHKGNGVLCPGDLVCLQQYNTIAFVLTLGLWGYRDRYSRHWDQISRPGVNLVLQLNFSREHDRAYEHLLKNPVEDSPFNDWGHPICKKGRSTMAWARIDVDFASNAALVEEIQNDWLRRAVSKYKTVRHLRSRINDAEHTAYWGCKPIGPLSGFIDYMENYLLPYTRSWSQAMLTAAIWFIVEELGIKNIWYHDYDTGIRLKQIDYGAPPRSIYRQLPKQFCFELTGHAPAFIIDAAQKRMRQRLKSGKERFWHLQF